MAGLSASIAAVMLEGSLYARYYDLPAPSTWTPLPAEDGSLLDKARIRWGKRTADDFAQICQERSKEAGTGDGSFVARNGAIIEQSQILATHNLAPLVHEVGLRDQLSSSAPHLASDAAYAWRQALFLVSLADEATQRQVIVDWRDQWSSAPTEWLDRFEPALIGLERVASGGRFDEAGRLDGGRRFLGWSVGPHWLAAQEPEKRSRS